MKRAPSRPSGCDDRRIEREERGASRRNFLKGAMVVGVQAAVLTAGGGHLLSGNSRAGAFSAEAESTVDLPELLTGTPGGGEN